MMNKVFILLDRSGSMASMWKEAIDGINNYVKKLVESEVMLVAFDTGSYEVVRNCSTTIWEPLSYNEISPRGGTPLLDAAGRIMWSMHDSGAKQAMLVIITDGHENSSTKFNADEIKKMTNELTINKNYDIVFLGANFDGIGRVAKSNFGWNDSSRMVQTSVKGFETTMDFLSAKTSNYFTTGAKAAALYNQDELNKAKS
jgi:hypothetical protein